MNRRKWLGSGSKGDLAGNYRAAKKFRIGRKHFTRITGLLFRYLGWEKMNYALSIEQTKVSRLTS